MSGLLVLCATPIGNLGDASPRLADTLAEADVVFAEDTRRTRVLLDHLGVDRPLRSFFVGNEDDREAELADRLRRGETVALVSDAGMPGVADPGVSAVRVARSVEATVSVVPGPSAVTAAVAASGFGADRFVFEGFLPRKGRVRADRLASVAAETRTVVLFSSSHRVVDDLTHLSSVIEPDRHVCVVRELTKRFEELWWGAPRDAATRITAEGPRGEYTIVVAPGRAPVPDIDEAVEVARRLVDGGASRSEAAREAAHQTGARRREIYDRLSEVSR